MHPKIYERNNDGKVCCPFCDHVEVNANTLHYHIKRKHDKIFDHPCPYCIDKAFYSKSNLDQHIKTAHPENLINHTTSHAMLKNYDCPFCDIKSSSKGNLKTHIARNHAPWINEYRPNKPCQHCTATTKSATSYYYHCIKCVPVPTEHINVENLINKALL
jgi:hypothetical protein